MDWNSLKKIGFLATVLMTPAAQATDFSLIFGGYSHHFQTNKDWCYQGECYKGFQENNKAIGFEYKDFSVISFTNSYNKPGLAAYLTLNAIETGYLEGGLRVGVVHGYGDTPTNLTIMPLLTPVINIKPYKDSPISVDLSLLISFSDAPVGTLNFKYNIGSLMD